MKTQLVKPSFIAGNEKSFFSFISSLDEGKIALVSHNDVDGITAAKISAQVIKPDIIYFVGYTELNDSLVEKLKKQKVKKIIFTDLSFSDLKFLKMVSAFADILIIDHHSFIEDFNSEKIVFLNAKGYCAGYLCYYLFSQIQDLENYDWLVACSCISDVLFRDNQSWIEQIYQKYGDKLILDKNYVLKNGKFWDLQYSISLALIYFKEDISKVYELIGSSFGDIGNLNKYSADVQKDIDDCLTLFNREKKIFNDLQCWEVHSIYPITSILINIISFSQPNITFVLWEIDQNNVKVSARRQDKKVDLPSFLRNCIEGFENSGAGGHIPAAGAFFPKRYLNEFISHLENSSYN